MNTPVNFELAKLLKEKGFDIIDCSGYYHICNGYTKGFAHCYSDVNTQKEDAILAPTIAEVVMWLYEKHGIWVSVDYDQEIQWYYNIVHISEEGGNLVDKFNSHIAAYLAAIDYTLNNLI